MILVLLGSACVVDNNLQKPGDGFDPSLDDSAGGTGVVADTDTTTRTHSADDACTETTRSAEEIVQVEECNPGALLTDPLEGAQIVATWESEDPTFCESAPVVAVVGAVPRVAYTYEDGHLRFVSALDGSELWEVGGVGGDVPGTAALGDLDGDGVLDVVVAGGGTVAAVRDDGTELWSAAVAGYWGICSAPALADLSDDGILEVIWGNRIYDGLTGSLRGLGAHGMGSGCCDDGARAIGVVADIDMDGILDVVVGNALYDDDGDTLWYNGEEDGFVAVANFDDDEYAEIVVAGNEHVRLQDDDGTVLWDHEYFPYEEYIPGWGAGPPAVGDFDADGRPEIALAGRTQILMLDGSTGAVVWEVTKPSDNSGWGSTSAFDIDGDGDDDVFTGDMETLWVLDGSTGTSLLELERSSGTCTETPVIADVTGDGHAEILVDGTVWTSAGDPWAEARPIWNQHAFSLTNVEDDGTIPSYPEPNWLSYKRDHRRAARSSTRTRTRRHERAEPCPARHVERARRQDRLQRIEGYHTRSIG